MKFSQHFWRGLVFLLLITALCGGMVLPVTGISVRAAPQMQAATNIVISEFRLRGPAGGTDEFIEIYNPTPNPVDISSWIISGSNNTGTTISTRATIPAGTFLQSGQHYLVAKSGGYSNTSVPADLLYTATGIADDGGIALIHADGITIIDQVGMSAGSAYGEGTRLTSLTTNTDQSYERQLEASGSCTDSNNNSTDFFLRVPSDPQNSSSPIITCGNPTQTPSPTSTSTSTSSPTSTLSPTTTNTPTNTPTITLTPTPVGFLSVIINEVAWAGTTAALTSDEWIELYNPGASPVNLAGWVLKSPDGTPTIALTGTIPADGFFLLERTDDTTVSDIAAD
ncbi:MAG: lamin tail domain-containing protein, partial [Anaerolineae bacterium]|nr:lamin tail domain-containing protein [Anaerolineae bacterium]